MEQFDTDNLVREFSKSVDDGLELQKEINEFAKEISGKLAYDVNGQGVLATFRDKHLSVKAFAEKNQSGHFVYSVKLLDLDEYAKALKLSVPETVRIKSFNFEHDESFSLKDEIRSVLALALLDFFGIEFGAEDLGEEEMVRIKA